MDKLEKAANDYSDSYYSDAEYPSEIRDIINDCRSAFKAGAKYQKENMWMDVEEDGYPPYDENCGEFEQEKYLLRYVSGSISPKISYRIGFLSNIYRFIGEMDWVKVTHWMPIPKLVK
jgi:hypothetical protein